MRNYKLLSVFNKQFSVWLWGGLLFVNSVYAVVNIENTRVVFNSDDKAVSVSLANSEKQPTLVQMWIDDGDMLAQPETIKSPIVISPPVFNMRPSEIRSVRLMLSSRSNLAKDKESLYWLNIYQIPPSTDATAKLERKVILPLRIRMKIFIRPSGVREIRKEDGSKLTFNLSNENGKTKLTISNPTPWHMNLNKVSIAGEAVKSMTILPKSEFSILLKKEISNYHKISYAVINDQGTNWLYQTAL